MRQVGLPEFHFHTIDLHRSTPAEAAQRYRESITSNISRPALGTQIWWVTMPDGTSRCLKEFYLADPVDFGRDIPDPIWRLPTPEAVPSGTQRGLAARRALLFDQMRAGTLKQEIARAGGQHTPFRSQFNAYSFEIESLITQFATHYGCDQIVGAYFWGPLQLQGRSGYRYAIEMERLEPLPLPPPGDALAMTHRLIQMMSAVVQLHAMLIPIRCYPPELISDISIARQHPIVRPFHYDLSPDQFMTRQGRVGDSDEVILIDFNASRTAKLEYSDFSWQTIPGKDYYQAPERRGHSTSLTETGGAQLVFQSNPIYDLYSLLVIGLFGFAREQEWEQRIQQLPQWQTLPAFYDFLFQPDLAARLQTLLGAQQGIKVGPLCQLMEAVLRDDPAERYERLRALPGLNWKGLQDWMLLPRATDYIARQTMGRDFQVAWKTPVYQCIESPSQFSLLTLLDQERCVWAPGPWERGRIAHPAMRAEELFFLQSEDAYPVVRGKQIEPRQAGRYTVYAMWGGCIDFAHPLTIEVQPDRKARSGSQDQEGITSPPAAAQDRPDAATHLHLAPQGVEAPMPTPSDPALAPTPPMSQPGPGPLAPVQHQSSPPSEGARPATIDFRRGSTPLPPNHLPPPDISLASPAPQTGTNNFIATIVTPTVPLHFAKTTNPTGPNRTPPPQFEIPAMTEDNLPVQAPPQLPQGQVGAPPDLRQWEREIPTCIDQQRLDFMEAFLKQLQQDQWVCALQLNICARRCQLLLDTGQLSPHGPSLLLLARMLEQFDGSDPNRGLLLNNLAVCCYESAYQHRTLPDWRKLFGFDPMAQLKSWLNRTDPTPHLRPAPWVWELRERSRETIAYCQKINRRLS